MSETKKTKRNIQVIDGALNCSYSLFVASVEDFYEIFPLPDQDIEYVEDFFERVGEAKAQKILGNLWSHPILKKEAMGIHGTLFYQGLFRKEYYDSKRECDMLSRYINSHQRTLFDTYKKSRKP